jgi:hypothetical protein
MGKKRKDAAAPPAPPSPTKAEATPASPSAARGAATADPSVPPPKPLSLRERILPEGGMLPWWVVLVFSVYCLLKLGLTLEHPCGVLGTHEPVTRSQIQKAYRSLSACTHPDKLVGYSADDVRRGELLFRRASTAREGLIAELKQASGSRQCAEAKERRRAAAEAAAAAAAAESGGEAAAAAAAAVADESSGDDAACSATCSTQLDTAIWQGVSYVFAYFLETGGIEVVYGFATFLWELVTFQVGPRALCPTRPKSAPCTLCPMRPLPMRPLPTRPLMASSRRVACVARVRSTTSP